jgi:hypothetical protein
MRIEVTLSSSTSTPDGAPVGLDTWTSEIGYSRWYFSSYANTVGILRKMPCLSTASAPKS